MTGGIWVALLEAQRHAQAITKTGKNTAQGWTFVTVEQVTRVSREALNHAGLIAVLRVDAYDEKHLHATLMLRHPASGQAHEFLADWPVERAGPQARRAAYAYARKQVLMELLMLAEPDPETDAGMKPVRKAATVQLGAPKPAAPPPKDDRAGMVTRAQLRAIHAHLTDLDQAEGVTRTAAEHRAIIAQHAGVVGLESSSDLQTGEASKVIDALAAQLQDQQRQ